MEVEHLDPEPGCLDRGPADEARRVVKLQVEENFSAAPADFADKVGAGLHEQMLADLEHSYRGGKQLDHRERFMAWAVIEFHDQALLKEALARKRERPVFSHTNSRRCARPIGKRCRTQPYRSIQSETHTNCAPGEVVKSFFSGPVLIRNWSQFSGVSLPACPSKSRARRPVLLE